MRKLPFLPSHLLLSFMVLIPHLTLAHTITKHGEEFYGVSYLPLFIIAKILPFVGMGMISYNQGSSNIPIRNHLMLLLGIISGMMLAFAYEGLTPFFVANSVAIIILGLLLLFKNQPNKLFIQLLLSISGISLGYEYTINISHAVEFKWLFISLLIFGVSLFLALNQIQFFKNGAMNLIRISAGILLVVAGLIVILLT